MLTGLFLSHGMLTVMQSSLHATASSSVSDLTHVTGTYGSSAAPGGFYSALLVRFVTADRPGGLEAVSGCLMLAGASKSDF